MGAWLLTPAGVFEWAFPLIFTIILIAPLLRYIHVGWSIKRDDIMTSLDATARKDYLVKFFKVSERIDEGEASAQFETMYETRYGRHFFAFPAALLVITTSAETYLVSQGALAAMGVIAKPAATLSTIAVSAIAGAYMWVVSDFISRSRRLDFSPSDVHWSTLRLSIAVALGYSFASLVKDDVGPFIAFALGAFPLDALTTALRRLANKKLDLDLGPSRGLDQLNKLQGIDAIIVDRLAQQDLTTIPQLAYCDPIQVTMRSNLSFNFVIDIVSQSLAWIYLDGDQLDKLRSHGLRGAYEIRDLVLALSHAPDGPPEGDRTAGDAAGALAAAAAALGLGPDVLKYTFEQIAYDPYTQFLHKVWN